MNVLLTGGLGFIGGHTAISLSRVGHSVYIYDSLINSDKTSIETLNQICDNEISCQIGDILDTKSLTRFIESNKIDTVIHFAALKSPFESISNPSIYFNNNVSGTISLIRAMENNKINSLIFSSSASVYGPPEYNPMDEKHPENPINPYGRSKLISEKILKDLAEFQDWKIIILRYFNPIGAHESRIFGEFANETPNNLLPYLYRVAKGDFEFVSIYGNNFDTEDGTGIRDYIDVMDVADGHIKSLEYIFNADICKKNNASVFNLGTGTGVSVLEMIELFEQVTGIEIKYKFKDRRKGDVGKCIADPSKAMEILNWKSKIATEESINNGWNFFKNNC